MKSCKNGNVAKIVYYVKTRACSNDHTVRMLEKTISSFHYEQTLTVKYNGDKSMLVDFINCSIDLGTHPGFLSFVITRNSGTKVIHTE